MAITYESAGKVRQKTRLYVKSPLILGAFKALFLHLATTRKNPDLAFLPFDGTDADAAGGVVLGDAATTLYAVYGRKTATGTDAYLVIFDDATDDTGAGTDGRVVIPFLLSEEEGFYMNPTGLTMGTGVVAKAYTDFDGTTDSTAGDAPNGFVIVGQG